MKQSKLKVFSPVLHEGQHQNWQSQNGVMWKFNIEFENGDKGQAMSSKQQPSWTVGNEFSYTLNVNGQYTNIKGMKDLSKGGSFGGPKKEDPLKQQMIIAQSSMDKAINIITSGAFVKEDGSGHTLADLKILTDRCMQIVNELANKHNK